MSIERTIPHDIIGGANQIGISTYIDAYIPTNSEYAQAIDRIATSYVEKAAKVKPGQKVLLWFDPSGLSLVQAINRKCKAIGVDIKYFMRNFEADMEAVGQMSVEEINCFFDEEKRMIDEAENVLIVRGPENPELVETLPNDKQIAYKEAGNRAKKRTQKGEVEWTMINWPTEYVAHKEKMTYDEFMRVFIDACDQPWDEIKAAQAKLIEKLNKGQKLEIYANENDPDLEKRTKLTMSIDGMTFGNSTIDRNYPGSEVFSAPVLNSVNGYIYADGEYIYQGSIIKDIHLHIVNGRIMEDSYAGNKGDKDNPSNKALQEILSRGVGARYFGEVAFGTNSSLTRRFIDTVLNEKVAGSFHMAIGGCYEFTEYAGEPVNVNNGNTSNKTNVHWDLTVLMHPQYGGGKVLVDDELIQENGKFLDPELKVLNPNVSST